mmetsp:Transcript_25954/g.47314  ORF Transcript_25954/g.47314 Transcript_25954/m.47314 type:complete len:123 (+) Transcript_25954:101-469(+)
MIDNKTIVQTSEVPDLMIDNTISRSSVKNFTRRITRAARATRRMRSMRKIEMLVPAGAESDCLVMVEAMSTRTIMLSKIFQRVSDEKKQNPAIPSAANLNRISIKNQMEKARSTALKKLRLS